MAELEIKSKVTLKYDTYSKWMASSLILKKGEIAIAELIQDDQETGLTPPTVGIKVGDGTKTFSKLPWIQAVAGDIYAWAKAKNKPTYEAEEIQNLQQFILTNVTDKNTIYQIVTTDEGHSYKLQKKDIEDEDFSDVDGSTVNLESIYTQLSSLQTKIEDIDVTEQIEAAIADLNYLDAAKSHEFVTAVNEANGKIDVTRASLIKEDIPTIEQSQVNGLTDALAGKQNTLVFGTAYNSESNKAATQTDIQLAIEEKLNDVGIKKEVVEELPDVKQMKDGVLYLVKRAAEKEKNIYDEYMLINGAAELIGNTETDLSGYAKTTDLKWANITDRPTALSQFTNDKDFIASTEVDTKIEQKRFKTQIAESIPQPEQMQDNIMYLVKTTDLEGNTTYDEYILVNNTAELVGAHLKEEDIENLIVGSMTFEIKQDSTQWETVQEGLYKTEITLSDNFSNLKNIAVVADVLQGADETENQTLRNDWPNVVRITYEDSTLTVYATKELTKLYIQLLVFKVGFTGNESFDLNNFVQKDQIANDVEPGLVKILDTIGQATDATMSQKAISDELAKANGVVGDYYYPTVDDVGNLSWELKTSSEVSELPATKSIRGPVGPTGAAGKDGAAGAAGPAGKGITSATLQDDYTLKIVYTDETNTTTKSIRGAQGPAGPAGPAGPTGPAGAAGRGISSAEVTSDYKLKLNYTDSTSFTSTTSIRGPQGPQGNAGAAGAAGPAGAQGPVGPAGKGISKVELQSDYTLKFTYTDSTTTTTGSVRGATGAAGPTGSQGPAGAQGPAGPNTISTATTTSGLNGLIKASGNKVAQATAGTDYVAPTTTVNGKALSGNITLAATDVSAMPYVKNNTGGGIDFNTVTANGFYTYQGESANPLKNIPVGNLASAHYHLMVWNIDEATAKYVRQVAYDVRTTKQYTRVMTNGTWSGWEQMYTTGNKPSAADIGALSATGNAATATKLQAAKNIAIAGDSTGNTNFDGSNNITITTQRRGCMVGQSSNTAGSNTWFKFASIVLTATNEDVDITFYVNSTYADAVNLYGILKAHVRTHSTTGGAFGSAELKWLLAGPQIVAANYVLAYSTTSPYTYELWANIPNEWRGIRFEVLSEGNRTARQTNRWTLYNTYQTAGSASVTANYTKITSVLNNIANASPASNAIQNETSTGPLDKYDGSLVTSNTIAFWNGAYDTTLRSNLAYCTKGAFGTMATQDSGSYVPTSRTVNGKALTSNISITATELGAVPTSRKINGQALTGDINISVPKITISTTDLTPGVSALSNGEIYLVYE